MSVRILGIWVNTGPATIDKWLVMFFPILRELEKRGRSLKTLRCVGAQDVECCWNVT